MDPGHTFLALVSALGGMDAVAINTMYSYAGDISHKSDKRSASIWFLIIDTFTYLHATALGIYCGDIILKHFGFL